MPHGRLPVADPRRRGCRRPPRGRLPERRGGTRAPGRGPDRAAVGEAERLAGAFRRRASSSWSRPAPTGSRPASWSSRWRRGPICRRRCATSRRCSTGTSPADADTGFVLILDATAQAEARADGRRARPSRRSRAGIKAGAIVPSPAAAPSRHAADSSRSPRRPGRARAAGPAAALDRLGGTPLQLLRSASPVARREPRPDPARGPRYLAASERHH